MMDLYAITYRLKAIKHHRTRSFIGEMTSNVVAQQLAGLDASETDDSTEKGLIGCR